MTQELVTTATVFSLQPRNLDEAMKYAEIIAKSDLVPADYKGKPGNVLIAIQWGQEIGLKPLQALQNIAVINGRPSLWGDAVLSIVRASGLLEDFREDFDQATFTATCSIKRKGQPSPLARTFSKDDALKAGLWDRNTWKNYPKRMAQLRARAFALRDGFADVIKGFAIAEEQQDGGLDATTSDALPPPPAPIEAPKAIPDGQEPTDWRDLTTKREGQCSACGAALPEGTPVLYSASARKIKCKPCPSGRTDRPSDNLDEPAFS